MESIGVFAIILNKNKILLCHRRDMDMWNLPGGRLENNETLIEGLKREVFEETGLVVDIIKLFRVYDKRPLKNELVYVYHCNIIEGELTINDEADYLNFFNFDNLPDNILKSHYKRIKDFLELSTVEGV